MINVNILYRTPSARKWQVIIGHHFPHKLEIQWNPSIKDNKNCDLSKEVACYEGKILICGEWCMEMDQILQLKWDIHGRSRGVPLYKYKSRTP